MLVVAWFGLGLKELKALLCEMFFPVFHKAKFFTILKFCIAGHMLSVWQLACISCSCSLL